MARREKKGGGRDAQTVWTEPPHSILFRSAAIETMNKRKVAAAWKNARPQFLDAFIQGMVGIKGKRIALSQLFLIVLT